MKQAYKYTSFLVLLPLLLLPSAVQCFAPNTRFQNRMKEVLYSPSLYNFLPSSSSSKLRLSNDPEPKTFQEKLDKFLDQPIFDPDKVLDNEEESTVQNTDSSSNSNNPLVWFANLVKNDYETAEALYAAAFISFMVVLSQELLRMVKYGDAYHPFQSVSNGSLF